MSEQTNAQANAPGGSQVSAEANEVDRLRDELRGLVDLDAVNAWAAGQAGLDAPLELVGRLSGGTQNIVIRVRSGERELILRRGPEHLRPRTNDNLMREMRVLEALRDTDMPHARIIAACRDTEVLGGSVFYLMDAIDGFNPSVELSPAVAESRDAQRVLALSSAQSIATLGAIDHRAVGLGDFGNPEGFLERQVGRWRSELEGYSALDGYPGPELPGVVEVGAWLDAHRPASWEPGILHGDYHLGNIMCDHSTGDIKAVIDWEMTTIGDPLLDLGWLLATWPRGREVEVMGQSAQPLATVVSRDELIAHYGQSSQRDLSAIDWYEVLACYKLGIILEGTHARACAGKAPKEIGDRLHAVTLELFHRAGEITG